MRWSPSLIWTEVSDIVHFYTNEDLDVKQIPRYACYNRTNYFTRAISLVSYFIYVFLKVFFNSPKALLFIVTTPPFLGLIGYLFKKLRKQRYAILVYDILPDVLIGAGLMKEGISAKLWRKINEIVLDNADAVITIGEYMAENMSRKFDVKKTLLGHIAVIHNWDDVDYIRPLPKEDNPFVRENGLNNKFVILYSGNIGATHDVKTLVEAAKRLKEKPNIQFVIIGEGAKKQFIVESKEKYGLDNMLIMSYLPQDQLRYTFPSADISIVTISNGVEGYLVPCKFYSYLAAGSAVIAICNPKCEIADIITYEQCGKVIALGDDTDLVETILFYYRNKDNLSKAKINSRKAAMEKYSRKNTQLYIDVIEQIYASK